jgi:hypothetical protein
MHLLAPGNIQIPCLLGLWNPLEGVVPLLMFKRLGMPVTAMILIEGYWFLNMLAHVGVPFSNIRKKADWSTRTGG